MDRGVPSGNSSTSPSSAVGLTACACPHREARAHANHPSARPLSGILWDAAGRGRPSSPMARRFGGWRQRPSVRARSKWSRRDAEIASTGTRALGAKGWPAFARGQFLSRCPLGEGRRGLDIAQESTQSYRHVSKSRDLVRFGNPSRAARLVDAAGMTVLAGPPHRASGGQPPEGSDAPTSQGYGALGARPGPRIIAELLSRHLDQIQR